MVALELAIKGVLAGLAISIPVGPVNVLCISRTLAKGPRAGLIAGLGAASADAIYGAVAGFSISFVIAFLVRELFWIRFFGGMLLIGIGFLYYFKRPKPVAEQNSGGSAHSDYVKAFLLNLTNPTTVLSFLAVLAALGLGQHRARFLTVLVVVGIFTGAMIWWATLAGIANRFRGRLNDRAMVWMNRIAGLAIGGFGVLTMLLSRGQPR